MGVEEGWLRGSIRGFFNINLMNHYQSTLFIIITILLMTNNLLMVFYLGSEGVFPESYVEKVTEDIR